MRAVTLAVGILSLSCTATTASGQVFDPTNYKYLYVEPCRASVQSVFKENIGQIFVVSVGFSLRNSTDRPIAGVTVDLLDKWDNVLSARTTPLAAGPDEASAHSIELYGLIISAEETRSPRYAGTPRIIADLERQYAVASCGIVGFKFGAIDAGMAATRTLTDTLIDSDRRPPHNLSMLKSERARQ